MKSSLIAAAIAAAITPTIHAGRVIYVDTNAPTGGDGDSWITAHRHLADALMNSVAGDDIRVADGLYRPDETAKSPNGTGDRSAVFNVTSGVAVYGGYAGLGAEDPDANDPLLYPTVLSGHLGPGGDGEPEDNNSFRIVELNHTTILDGVTVERASGDEAIRISTGADATILRCLIHRNEGTIHGGGIGAADAGNVYVADCVFERNTSELGSGMSINGGISLTVERCLFHDNAASAACGGLMALFVGTVEVTDCWFENNTGAVGMGGGAYIAGYESRVDRCQFIRNWSPFRGGGLATGLGETTVTNTVFSQNESVTLLGGGAFVGSDTTFINCSFSRNGGYAIANEATMTCHNCILWQNDESIDGGATVTYSCIQGGWPGIGNIDTNPMFVQAGVGDLRLAEGSPCLDAGNADYLPAGIDLDVVGAPRVQDAQVDMGAYEGAFAQEHQEMLAVQDLDPQEYALAVHGPAGWRVLDHETLFISNNSSAVTTDLISQRGPASPGIIGHSPRTVAITQESDLVVGEHLSLVTIPFGLDDLAGADPMHIDLIELDDDGRWSLAVAHNSVDAIGGAGPIGPRSAVTAELELPTFGSMGHYGVLWNPARERGVAWAVVDHGGTFAAGIPRCVGDCAQPVDGLIGMPDLISVIGHWGFTGGPWDVDFDGSVGFTDLFTILQRWGSCD